MIVIDLELKTMDMSIIYFFLVMVWVFVMLMWYIYTILYVQFICTIDGKGIYKKWHDLVCAMSETILAENGLFLRHLWACCNNVLVVSYDRDPFDPRLSDLHEASIRPERLQERPDRVKPRHWRFRRHWLKASSSSSSSMSSRWSCGIVNEKVALSESLLLTSSSSKEGHSIAGNAMVSSTFVDAFRKSPISNDPDVKRDRVRFKGAERWVSALSQPVDGRFRETCSPFSMLIRAFVARSLLIWIIFFFCLK